MVAVEVVRCGQFCIYCEGRACRICWWMGHGGREREESEMTPGILAWASGLLVLPFMDVGKTAKELGSSSLGILSLGVYLIFEERWWVGSWIFESKVLGNELSWRYKFGNYQHVDGVPREGVYIEKRFDEPWGSLMFRIWRKKEKNSKGDREGAASEAGRPNYLESRNYFKKAMLRTTIWL